MGFAVFFLARVLGALYIINNVHEEQIAARSHRQLLVNFITFLIFFLAFLVHTLLKDGYAYNPATGLIFMEPMKYLHNLTTLWPVAVLLLIGVVLVVILEGAMAAMWYAMGLERKWDTRDLNRNLKIFQGE